MVYTTAITPTQIAVLGLTDSPSAADHAGRDSYFRDNIKRNREGLGDAMSQGRGKNRHGRGRDNKGNGDNRHQHIGDSRGGTRGGPAAPRLGAHPLVE